MGVGVFATHHIGAGKVIVKNNATPFNERDWQALKKTVMGPMMFEARTGRGGFAVWGDISLINHSDEPNADIDAVMDDGRLKVLLVAMKRIYPGQEIFIRYKNIADAELYPWHEKRSA